MDLSKLNGLSLESLLKIKAYIDEILDARQDKTIRIGSYGTFLNAKTGETIKCYVDRVNRLSLGVTEVKPKPGRKWRVSVSAFRLSYVESKKYSPPTPKVKHAIETDSSDHW